MPSKRKKTAVSHLGNAHNDLKDFVIALVIVVVIAVVLLYGLNFILG